MAQKFDEGKIEGKMERDFEIAYDLLKKKYDIKTISDITGLNIDQINSIPN